MIISSLKVDRIAHERFRLRTYQPLDHFAQQMSVEGTLTFPIDELCQGIAAGTHFHGRVDAARQSRGPHGACLHLYSAVEYAKMRLFMDELGEAGFALYGSEVVSVFAHRDRIHSKASRTLMNLAVAVGGRTLNAFDTVLPDIYRQCGFREVARLAWKDAEAPNDWDYGAMSPFNSGRPDVVFMAHTFREVPLRQVSSYEEGIALQEAATAPLFVEVAS